MEKVIRNDDLKDYYDALCLLYYGGVNRQVLEFVLSLILPKDENGKNLVKSSIKDISDKEAASFIPETNTIRLAMNSINGWLENNALPISDKCNYKDLKRLKSYLLLFMLTHEIEHSYQYLIAKDVVICDETCVRNGFKILYDMIVKPTDNSYINNMKRVYHLKLYDKDHDNYVLERNANIEAADKMLSLSAAEQDIALYQMFASLRIKYMKIGYSSNNLGSFDETMKKIKLFNKYKSGYVPSKIDEIDKIRYGLPIKEESRELLLRKKF